MEWVPVQLAACRLGISPSTVHRWLASGKLTGRVTQRGRRASYLVQVPAPLAPLSQGDRDQIEVLRSRLATREMQLAVLTEHNEKLERDLDALRRTLLLQTRRRIADAALAASTSTGILHRVPFLRLLGGRRNVG